jgi:hypothetical protein
MVSGQENEVTVLEFPSTKTFVQSVLLHSHPWPQLIKPAASGLAAITQKPR